MDPGSDLGQRGNRGIGILQIYIPVVGLQLVLLAFEHTGRSLHQLVVEVGRGLVHRDALDKGGAATRCGPCIRGAGRIGRNHPDGVDVGAHDLRRYLSNDGHDSLAHVTGPGIHRGGAVIGHLDVSRAYVGAVEPVADAVEH